MRRRHAISPGFCGHYQDLGTPSFKSHDYACNDILSVGTFSAVRRGVAAIASSSGGKALVPLSAPPAHDVHIGRTLFEHRSVSVLLAFEFPPYPETLNLDGWVELR